MSNLASLLKRKVARLNTQSTTDDEAKKYKHRKSQLEEMTPELVAQLKATNTRTARRKLRLAQQQLREQKQQAKKHKTGVNGNATTGGSDSENDDIAAAATGDIIDPSSGPDAYETLLASLKSNNKALAAAYHQRQKELAGDSGESSSSEEEELEEEDSDLEEDGDDDDVISEEEGNEQDVDNENSDDEAADEDVDDGNRRSKRLKSSKDDDKPAVSGDSTSTTSDEDGYSEEEEEEIVEDSRTIGRKRTLQQVGNNKSDAQKLEEERAENDPFLKHFDRELTATEIEAAATGKVTYTDLPADNKELNAWPQATVQSTAVSGENKATDTSQKIPVHDTLSEYAVRERLVSRWKEVVLADNPLNTDAKYKKATNSSGFQFVSPQQRALFSLLSSYQDILHPARPYPTQDPNSNSDPELDAVLLHILNHCARTADKVKKNNEKIDKSGKDAAMDLPRDQGFTRPKVLILLPMRNVALRVVNRLLQLAIKETRTDSIKHKHRFLEEFGQDEDDPISKAKAQQALSRKPAEYQILFDGNMDDHFRLGIKLTRGSVRLYTDFFQSDIIIASPLALATKLNEVGTKGGKDGETSDFLSSIEILVMERTDVMMMQNWAHVLTVVNALNCMPKEQHDTDIMRIKEWYLSGQAKHYRQTIVLGSLLTPELNAFMARTCVNAAGKVRILPRYTGVLSDIVPQARQLFERLPLPSDATPTSDLEARFQYFVTKTWPRIKEAAHGGGQLLYIPSYFDFVRVRNFLKSETASFLAVSEYTDRSDAARARSLFADGRKRVLIYTERAQFYHRYRIRGIKDIFFYQLPEHPQFYSEMVNLVEEASVPGAELPTVTTVFGKFDSLRLSRVVGSRRGATMLKKKSDTNTFLFC